MFMKIFVYLGVSLLSMNMLKADINLDDLEKKLMGDGLVGEIHAVANESKLYVFTYRNPTNFFENIELPLTSESKEIMNTFSTMKRHQMYNIQGNFLKNHAPIKHINVTALKLVTDYKSEVDHSAYNYKGDINDLINKKEFIGRVHAIGENGKMLVMEYMDRIIPVYVSEPATQAEATKLFRGDLIRVRFFIRAEPESPMHLSLQKVSNLAANEKPFDIIESLVANHGKSVTMSGYLIKFPQSPQIKYNIYALLIEDKVGSTIQLTLANLENPEIFTKVRQKLEDFWNLHDQSAENDRNKLVNRKVIVTAKGTYNMIDPGQANPQILINSVDDIDLKFNP